MKPITKAFEEMNNNEIIAFKNFCDCRTCALASLEDYREQYNDKREGYCFYTQQDAADLKKNGSCYLSFGLMNDKVKDRTGVKCRKIANQIINILQEQGLKTEWDGSNDTRIKVYC